MWRVSVSRREKKPFVEDIIVQQAFHGLNVDLCQQIFSFLYSACKDTKKMQKCKFLRRKIAFNCIFLYAVEGRLFQFGGEDGHCAVLGADEGGDSHGFLMRLAHGFAEQCLGNEGGGERVAVVSKRQKAQNVHPAWHQPESSRLSYWCRPHQTSPFPYLHQ